MIVSLPIGIALIFKVCSDGTLGKRTEAISDDIVLSTQSDTRIVHLQITILIHGHAGNAVPHAIGLQDSQHIGSGVIIRIRQGNEPVGYGDTFENRFKCVIVSLLHICNRTCSSNGLLSCRLGGIHCCLLFCRELLLHIGNQLIQVMAYVCPVIIRFDVCTVPVGIVRLGIRLGT